MAVHCLILQIIIHIKLAILQKNVSPLAILKTNLLSDALGTNIQKTVRIDLL